MSKQQASVDVLEGNLSIALFMGAHLMHSSTSPSGEVTIHAISIDDRETSIRSYEFNTKLKYHSSWDWLKPVIDEIFTYALAHPEQVKVIRDISIVVEIGACWQKVVEFIKWKNQNKQS